MTRVEMGRSVAMGTGRGFRRAVARPARTARAVALLSAVSLGALMLSMPSARASVIDGGAIVTVPGSQTSPWNLSGEDLYVGVSGAGTLAILSGGDVTSREGIIGDSATGYGIVTILGDGSTWTATSLTVGTYGTGSITVSQGGALATSGYIYLGDASSAVGTVTVTGAGSSWNAGNSSAYIGVSGGGTLVIANGGAVTTGLSLIGSQSGGVGSVTITDANSRWNASSVRVGAAGGGTLTIEDGGTLETVNTNVIGTSLGATGTVIVTGANSAWNAGTAELYVGYRGTGTLTIADGGAVTSGGSFIGYEATGIGEVTITGENSRWGATFVAVGDAGGGTLTIEDGGTLATSSTSAIGGNSGSTGTVTVTGANSAWNAGTADLIVGYSGTGTLSIAAGGAVTSLGSLIGYEATGIGEATITGTGSRWDASSVRVGNAGRGTLTIEDGGTLATVDANYIGRSSGSTGTVTVTGDGSAWNAGTADLYVGYRGTGTLTIKDGGAVRSGIGLIAEVTTGVGDVTITGADSRWDASSLSVGQGGQGTLTIEDGGTLATSSASFIGDNPNSTGTVTVTGANSAWNAGIGYIYVGSSGTGTLNIADGGAVTSAGGYIGTSGGSTGTVTVTGAGSSWNAGSGTFTLGSEGAGSLTISNGGSVSAGYFIAGSFASSTGTMTVTGTGSSLTTSGDLIIGALGSASLTVSDRGSVVGQGDSVYVGRDAGSTSTATITGAGSSLTGNSLNIAYAGTGTVTVAAGGSLSFSLALLAVTASSTGTLNLEGTDGARGVLTTGQIVANSGTASLTFDGGVLRAAGASTNFLSNFTSSSVEIESGGAFIDSNSYAVEISTALDGVGGLTKLGTGSLTLAGTNSYSGGTTIAAGTLRAAADENLGDSAGGISFTGGALGTTGTFTSNRSISLGSAGGTINTASTTTLTLTGTIAGTGSLTKDGAGTLILTDIATYVGATVINAGTLALSGSGSIATSSAVAVTGSLDLSAITSGTTIHDLSGSGTVDLDTKTLTILQNTALSFSGVLEGSGVLIKDGSGILTLTGDSRGFSGTTQVAAGTLVVSNAGGTTSGMLGGDVSVGLGATLQGAGGTISGATTVASGAVLAGSQDGGTLTFGSLTLDEGAITSVTLSTATTASAIFTTIGDLTVDGTLNISSAPGYGVGVYRVFASGGTLTDNGLTLGSTPSGNYTTSLEVSSSAVDVLEVGIPTSLQYWSADASSQGGSGTWTASNTWLNSDSSTAAWGGNTAVFSGAAGTVSVDGTQSFATLEFLTTGYEVATGVSGSLDLGAGGLVWAEGAGVTATISTTITGSGALSKVGAGTIVLSGTNTYAGGTVLQAGILQVASDDNLGAASGGLSFTGGTLATTASFTSARSVSLASAGGTIDTASETTLVLAGNISGSGGLTKEGEGTLILTGTNTYTGVTTINAGILQIGNGGTTGSILGDVVNNASLVFNRSDAYTFPGTITGSGSVSFTGSGTVLFSDPGAYIGPVLVSDTTVHLEDTQSDSVFTLDAGALLNGNGTIGGLVANSGSTVAPGNSPGTITVNGAVTFNAGSVYQVDVTTSGDHDLITATGAVTLSSGATVEVLAETGVYAANTTYAIITTTNTVSGTFGSVTSNYAFLTASLSYDLQNVYLTLVYNNVAFSDYADTPNEVAAADAAAALGRGNAVYDAIVELSEQDAAGAFAALSGEVYASTDTVIQQQSVYVRDAVGARLRQSEAEQASNPASLALAYASAGPAKAPIGPGLTPVLWAQGYGGWGNSFNDGNASTISNTIGGFLVGADIAVADTARAGLFGGFSRSNFDVDAVSSSGSMDNYDVGVYAGAQFGRLAARGGLAYAWHDVSVDRAIGVQDLQQTTSADYSTGSVQAFGELGYQTQLGRFDMEPFVGLTYLHISGTSFEESGGSAALSVDVGSMDTTYTTLGIRLATAVELQGHVVTPNLTLGWQHAFGDTSPAASMMFSGGTTPFDVSGAPIADDTLLLEAGLGYALSERSALNISYSGQFADAAAQNAFTARFAVAF